jgi:hypothetical protein
MRRQTLSQANGKKLRNSGNSSGFFWYCAMRPIAEIYSENFVSPEDEREMLSTNHVVRGRRVDVGLAFVALNAGDELLQHL